MPRCALVDARHLGRRTRLDVPVHGDVGATMRMPLPVVERKKSRRFLKDMLKPD